MAPPPPAQAKAAKVQKEKKANKKSKNAKPVVIEVVNGKLVPPPPIPAKATKAQKEKYKKAMKKYKKEAKNIPPPPPPKKTVGSAIENTGYIKIKGDDFYFHTKNDQTNYYNRWGNEVTEDGKIITLKTAK